MIQYLYKKYPMYLSGSQVRRERTGCHTPSTKEGPSMSMKKKNKGASTVGRKTFGREEKGTIG
jgi:hypothetical protein